MPFQKNDLAAGLGGAEKKFKKNALFLAQEELCRCRVQLFTGNSSPEGCWKAREMSGQQIVLIADLCVLKGRKDLDPGARRAPSLRFIGKDEALGVGSLRNARVRR